MAQVSYAGQNVVREHEGDWWYVTWPGLDEPILAVQRAPGTGEWLPVVSDGRGELIAIADSGGQLNSAYTGPEYDAGLWNSSGLTSHSRSFNPRRWATPGGIDTISTFRSRQYDPATGKWLQEDPIGVAGGVNLYQYNGNDPNSFSDAFGTCPPTDRNSADCPNTDLGNAWRVLHRSKVGRHVISDYVSSNPDVDTNIATCNPGNASCTSPDRRSVHVSGNAPATALHLAHEIVHVRGDKPFGTGEYVMGEELPAWQQEFQVFKTLSPAEQVTSGFSGRYDLWNSNRTISSIKSFVSPSFQGRALALDS